VIFGNDSSAASSYKQAALTARTGSTANLHSGMVFQAMNSCITMNLSSLLGMRGAAWTLSGACASGAHAVGQASEWIKSGRLDRVVCGAAQEITWESVCSFDALNAFSLREYDPAGASRPFDVDRDGLVPSGGAAALVLEERQGALKRGARVLGEILSYAFSSDGGQIALGDGEGLRRCMAEALERSGSEVSGIDHINAHGTSTSRGDAAEAEAIKAVFGKARPWVSSTKSQTGHEMWMSGASQAVYSILMGRKGFIAGNRNFRKPDDRTEGLRISSEVVEQPPGTVLCNSAGFGGTNACLVLRTGE
jgi:3-oxoacyl-[acyl-carrier-protein] synthase-1